MKAVLLLLMRQTEGRYPMLLPSLLWSLCGLLVSVDLIWWLQSIPVRVTSQNGPSMMTMSRLAGYVAATLNRHVVRVRQTSLLRVRFVVRWCWLCHWINFWACACRSLSACRWPSETWGNSNVTGSVSVFWEHHFEGSTRLVTQILLADMVKYSHVFFLQ